jgi:hypothetical protein
MSLKITLEVLMKDPQLKLKNLKMKYTKKIKVYKKRKITQ